MSSELNRVQYGITSGNTDHAFAVDFQTGNIYQVGTMDLVKSPVSMEMWSDCVNPNQWVHIRQRPETAYVLDLTYLLFLT